MGKEGVGKEALVDRIKYQGAEPRANQELFPVHRVGGPGYICPEGFQKSVDQ